MQWTSYLAQAEAEFAVQASALDLQDVKALLESEPKENDQAVAMLGALTPLPGSLSAGAGARHHGPEPR